MDQISCLDNDLVVTTISSSNDKNITAAGNADKSTTQTSVDNKSNTGQATTSGSSTTVTADAVITSSIISTSTNLTVASTDAENSTYAQCKGNKSKELVENV